MNNSFSNELVHKRSEYCINISKKSEYNHVWKHLIRIIENENLKYRHAVKVGLGPGRGTRNPLLKV